MTIQKIKRSKRPEALEIPAVSDAITVANGFKVDAKHPICEPSKIMATPVKLSKPTDIITGTRSG